MSALIYLTGTRIKNSLKETLHRPSKLILYLFLLAMVVLVVVSGSVDPVEGAQLRDIREFHAMVLGLVYLMFFLGAYQGFRSGASFYSMADVNLLFQTPLSPKGILIYGLVRQMGVTLLTGCFLVFQYGWLHTLYGISLGDLLLVLLCYALTLFCSQITAMALYSYLGTHPQRRTPFKAGFVLLLILLALYFILPMAMDPGNPTGPGGPVPGQGHLFSPCGRVAPCVGTGNLHRPVDHGPGGRRRHPPAVGADLPLDQPNQHRLL